MDAALAAIDAHNVASGIFDWIGQALLFGTVLAGLTSLLTRVLRRRLRPAFEAALWSVVLIKFLVPTGPPCSFSLASVCATSRCD